MVGHMGTVGKLRHSGARNVPPVPRSGSRQCWSPMQAGPTIIEDNCFIGARSPSGRGLLSFARRCLGMGVFIGKSTRIVDARRARSCMAKFPPFGRCRQAPLRSKEQREPLLLQ